MEMDKILQLLQNSGISVRGVDNNFIYFDDPSCIYTAFDTFLNYAWIVIVILTVAMLFGWAILYIKNGTKINELFDNAKTVILIFAILGAVKPIVNFIYHDNLFGKGCDVKQVSISNIQELIKIREKTLSNADENSLYEVFEIVDSGPIYTFDNFFVDDSTENSVVNNLIISDNAPTNSPNSKFLYAQNNTNYVIYTNPKGEKIKRSGGSSAWRNNNPGNIINSKFAREHGALNTSGKFAVFPDAETGTRAIKSLLQTKSYINLTIRDTVHRWAPAADNNNPQSYTAKLVQYTGLSPNIKINALNDHQLNSVVNAIRNIEGWEQGFEQKI